MKRLILPLIMVLLIAGVVMVSCQKEDEYVDTYVEETETKEEATTTTAKPTTKPMPTWQAAPTTTTTAPTKPTKATLPTKKVIPTYPPTTTTERPVPPETEKSVENLPPVTAAPNTDNTDNTDVQNKPGSGSEYELPTIEATQSGFVGLLVDILG